MLPLTRIAILALEGAAPTHVCRLIEARGLQVTVATSLPAAGEISTTSTSGMWIAFLELEQIPGFSHLSVLLQTTHFHAWPLLVVSHNASALEVALRKAFPAVGSVNLPCDASLIVDAALQLWRRSRSTASETAITPPSGGTNLKTLDQSSSLQESSTQEHPRRLSLVHNFVRDITRFSESGIEVGGALYGCNVRDLPFLKFLAGLEFNIAEVDTRIGARVDAQVRSHLTRAAYIAYCLLTALGVAKGTSLRGTRISLLLAKSCAASRALALSDYVTTRDLAVRARVASALEKSAMLISADPVLAIDASVVDGVRRLIQQESLSTTSPDTPISESLFAADLIDRVCFAAGFFRPSRASLLLRMIRGGELPNLPPKLLATIARFLCEAIVSCPPGIAMPGPLFKAYQKPRQDKIPRPTLLKDEVEVSIQNLTPGMLLARALKTLDGVAVLEPEQKLDADLIWRLWQLTAQRPVDSAVIRGKRRRRPAIR